MLKKKTNKLVYSGPMRFYLAGGGDGGLVGLSWRSYLFFRTYS